MEPHHGPQTGKLRTTADDLRKAGRFAEAADAYAAIWPDGDCWTGWAYALCLRKTKKSEEALRVAREVLKLAPEFELGRAICSWALFDLVRQATEPNAELLERATEVVSLSGQVGRAYEPISPLVPTVLRVARLLAIKGRHQQVLDWLHRLDSSRLPTEEFRFIDLDGKERRLASPLERYHSLKTYALEKLGRWDECLAAAEGALTCCASLHHDNDIWFARRAARARVKLGQHAEGIAGLTRLATRKPSSFIHADIAEAAWELGDTVRAGEHCLLALQSPGEIGYKLAPLLLLARVYWRTGRTDDARRHLILYIAYREQRGWRVGGDARALADEWGAVAHNVDVRTLSAELAATWRGSTRSAQGRRVGVILSLLPHGRAGFITAGEQERYYFDTRDWKDRRNKPMQGVRVTFNTRPGFDRKRERPSVVACDIRSAS